MRRPLETLARLSKLSTLLAIAILLTGSSCNGSMPKWHGKIWAGHSPTQSVRRTQANESFKTADPRFDTGAWISYVDIRALFDILQSCKEWEKALPMVPVAEFLESQPPELTREAEAALSLP